MESSRIFVRGLPPNLTLEEFRRHFSKETEITDAKFIPHRRIGYVGYKSHDDAAKAVKYHNKTFIRMSRIAVELARSVDDQKALKQRGATASGGTEAISIIPQQDSEKFQLGKRKRAGLGTDGDSKLQEYLEVMQPPSKSKIWANEDSSKTQTQIHHNSSSPPRALDGAPNDDEYDVLEKRKKLRVPNEAAEYLHKSTQSIPITDPHPGNGANVEEASQLTHDGAQISTDEDWLRSRTSRFLGLEEAEEPPDSTNQLVRSEEELLNRNTMPLKLIERNLKDPNIQTQDEAEKVGSTQISLFQPDSDNSTTSGRLFVRNLSYNTSEEDLKRHFEIDGASVLEVHIPRDSRTGLSKGFAYVQYTEPEAATSALKALDGQPFQGRLLHIIPALTKKQPSLNEFDISKMPLKKQQLIKRRAEAASSTFNWNSLYMNADAVMSSISDRLGVSKSELLDPTSSDAAVKQAHAETHVIQETKSYFAANGVNLDAFKGGERGDIAILVKNFSYGIKPDELRKLFEAHGNVLRLLMPPAGTISIVEFEKAEHARSAFKTLAYRKFKDSVLFLEKAPKLLLHGVNGHIPITEINSTTLQGVKPSTTDLLEDDKKPQILDTSTLFVRNLSFLTTTERLRELFSPLDGFLTAKIKMKPDPKKPGQFLSMGFGFLEFSSKQHAQVALTAMDGYKLDGHELLIRASHKAVDAAEQRRKEDEIKKIAGRRTKVIIKNLPFEVSKKDVRALFGSYGQLRSVRLPKKFDSSTRGFAFADFVTAREAENAMAALKDTHLLGRRLILEFAAEDALDAEAEIEKMQNKMGSQANKVALQKLSGLSSRRKFNVDTGENFERD